MTCCSRTPLLASVLLSSFLSVPSFPQSLRPSERYQAMLQRGTLEPRVRSFVSICLHASVLPRPVQFYSQGAWFVTPDLALHIKQDGSDDEGTAQVWEAAGKPRAVSVWIHDDEFDRTTLACLNDAGVVMRQVNAYMPGLSEPDLHWICIHSFIRIPPGRYRLSSRYTDWNSHPIAPPKLTSEDRDFIAGERHYEHWNDFDFADALSRSKVH